MTAESHNPQFRFPQTRLLAPQLGGDILIRPYLLKRLQQAVTSHSFTLISAPAGSGKTTLVAVWLHDHPPFPTAWLRLDEEDNDPGVFFAALLATLRQVDSDFGTDWQSLLVATSDISGAAW